MIGKKPRLLADLCTKEDLCDESAKVKLYL